MLGLETPPGLPLKRRADDWLLPAPRAQSDLLVLLGLGLGSNIGTLIIRIRFWGYLLL